MNLKPLYDRVVIKPVPQEEKINGIIIPDTAKEKPTIGEVIAVGAGSRGDNGQIIPLILKVGDKVLYNKWSGTESKIDGNDIVIMKESDVMGIIA